MSVPRLAPYTEGRGSYVPFTTALRRFWMLSVGVVVGASTVGQMDDSHVHHKTSAHTPENKAANGTYLSARKGGCRAARL